MHVSNLNLKTLPFHLMKRKTFFRLSYNATFFVFGCHLINLKPFQVTVSRLFCLYKIYPNGASIQKIVPTS